MASHKVIDTQTLLWHERAWCRLKWRQTRDDVITLHADAQQPSQPDRRADYGCYGDEDEPEPDEYVDFLAEQIDRQDTLDCVKDGLTCVTAYSHTTHRHLHDNNTHYSGWK